MQSVSQGRILVVDDDAGIRTVLKRILETGGYQVVLANSGFEALELASAHQDATGKCPYDLILTDLGMPEMDGWSVVKAFRSRWDALPVVLVTGWGEDIDNNKAQEYKITEIISKPFNLHVILGMVSKYIVQP